MRSKRTKYVVQCFSCVFLIGSRPSPTDGAGKVLRRPTQACCDPQLGPKQNLSQKLKFANGSHDFTCISYHSKLHVANDCRTWLDVSASQTAQPVSCRFNHGASRLVSRGQFECEMSKVVRAMCPPTFEISSAGYCESVQKHPHI